MPQGDGTGPAGQGSMTGRGMGFCAGYNTNGFMNGGFGRGRGFAGRGRAFQPMPIRQAQPAAITEKQEKQFLEQELNNLKKEIEGVEKRLKELNDELDNGKTPED